MLYPITSIRPTATNENQIVLAYHPRNAKDVPESERKVSQFCVLPIPRIDGLLPASIEYRFILQAVISQAKALLEDAVKSGITELPAFTLEDLLESVNESADGIGRLSKDKINEFIKLHGIAAKAAAVMAEKNGLAADHPAVIKKLGTIAEMIHSLASKGRVVEAWLETSEAFINKYFPADEAMTAKLKAAIAKKREENRKALEVIAVDNIEF